SEAALLRVRFVRVPFVLACVVSGRDQNRKLGKPRREKRFVTQVFTEMLYTMRELRHVHQCEKGSAHPGTRAGGNRIVNLALVCRQLRGLDHRKSAHFYLPLRNRMS